MVLKQQVTGEMVWLMMMHLGLSLSEGKVQGHLYMLLHTMK
jgi:uncharacterized protein YneF (UPF0154 family)